MDSEARCRLIKSFANQQNLLFMDKNSIYSSFFQVSGSGLINRPNGKCHNCGQLRQIDCEVCNGLCFDERAIP